MTGERIGVGIIGSGSVTQGIHLPTLARLSDVFEVRNIMDVDRAAATAVAERVGATASTSLDELLTDPSVEVVAVCSPHSFHAAQVIAVCRAGVRGVLCEKPFATSREEAETIAEVSRDTGVPIVVGAMHTFDPAYLAARAQWGDLQESAQLIRSSIILPPNLRFEQWATEADAPGPVASRDLGTPQLRAAAMRARMIGLAIHDLPLVRAFLPGWRSLRVISATLLEPVGYAVTIEAEGRVAHLSGSIRDHWLDEWEFEAIGPQSAVALRFTPSYVHAGSARAEIVSQGQRQVIADRGHNGYEGEWRHLADLVRGVADPAACTPMDDLVDDLTFAVLLADLAAQRLMVA